MYCFVACPGQQSSPTLLTHRYGLILPSKNKNKVGGELGTRKLNPLLDSDDELDQDEEYPLDWVEASLKVCRPMLEAFLVLIVPQKIQNCIDLAIMCLKIP